MDSAVDASRDDRGRAVQLDAVRIGVRCTVLACLGLGLYPMLPGHGELENRAFGATLAMAVIGVSVVALMPWRRLLRTRAGVVCFYVWSLVDIVLIAEVIHVTGGTRSPLFAVYALTTVFAAITYPRSGRILVLVLTIASYTVVLVLDHGHGFAVFVVGSFTLVALALLTGFLSNVLVVARQESDRRAELLETVAVAARAMSTLDPDQVMAAVVDAVERLGLEATGLVVFDAEGATYRATHARGLPPEYCDETHPATVGMPAAVLAAGATIVVNDFDDDTRGNPMLRGTGFKACIVPPVWVDGRLAAVLVGGTRTARAVPPEEIEAVNLLAAQAGTAILNAERFERLAELDRLKQDFVSTVSHELRTPLTVIQGLGKTLARRWDDLDEGLRFELLQRLNDNGDSLSDTITALLDFSRLEAGRLEVRPEDFDLSGLVSRIAGRVATLFSERPLHMAVEPGVWATADPQLVERVVENLLSNAAKHTPAGCEVTVTLERAADTAQVVVRDSGDGIPAHELAHLGDRFFRGGEVHTRKTRGTGLGLAFAREVLELHGQALEIESEVGVGSTFGFSLPLASAPSSWAGASRPSDPEERSRATAAG